MAKDDIEDLKKLSPTERIKKLKELQEKDKKEIEEAQKLISQSQEEEAREKELEKIPIPQVKAINIEDLFSSEEKELFKEKRQVSKAKEVQEIPKKEELEEIAETAPRTPERSPQEQAHIEYLSQKPAAELQERMADIYQDVKDTGYMSNEQKQEISQIGYANNLKFKAAKSGKYSNVSEKAADAMIETQKQKNLLQEKYETGTIYKRAA